MKNISKQIIEAYNTLLKYSQLALEKEICFRNVNLSSDTHIHQIYTLKNSDKQFPHLVLLHGFAGSAMSYIRTFNNLSKHFHVHALDHYGNGFSTRTDYDFKRTQDEILSLYVNSIEQWRKKSGINKMTLVGHSFGAYIATLYMQKNYQNVQRLILLSPVGTSKQNQIEQELSNRKEESFKNKFMLSMIQKIYNLKIQPSKAFSLPIIGDFLVDSFLKSTIKLETEQKQMWKYYIKYISTQQSHLQKSFYQCFEWPFVSKLRSICEIIEEIVKNSNQKSIEFYYGEKDWTENIGAKKLQKICNNVHFQIIPKATHNMIFDFPFEVCDRIISGPLENRLEFAKL